MTRREILAVVVIILILVLILFPVGNSHEMFTGPNLRSIHETLLKSASEHHPLVKSQLKELIRPLEVQFNHRFRFNLVGTEESWTLIVAHDDSEFFDQSGLTLLWHRLNYYPHAVYILSSADNSLTIVSQRGVAIRSDNDNPYP